MAQQMRIKMSRKKIAIVCGVAVVAVAGAVWAGLAIRAKNVADREAEREAEIVQKVEDYRDGVVESSATFITELNGLATGIYWDGENFEALTGEKIDQYIERLAEVKVPSEFEEVVEEYRAAWDKLRENFAGEKYDETKAALEEIKTLAETTSAEINSRMDEVISSQIEEYERSLRE